MYPNLKLQLWKSGIRQNRLAKMLDMDETALSRIVNGFREPSAELQDSIATVLQCSAAWLFQPQTEFPPAPDRQALENNPGVKSASTAKS